MSDWQQPLATALAGTAAIATVVFTVVRDRHPIAMIERLTAVAKDVRAEQVRSLVEDERDERAIRWVLERRAPKEARLFVAGLTLRWVGGAALLVWLAGAFADHWALWAWASYAVGLVVLIASRAVLEVRSDRRTAWMDQERNWRHLAKPEAAARVPKH